MTLAVAGAFTTSSSNFEAVTDDRVGKADLQGRVHRRGGVRVYLYFLEDRGSEALRLHADRIAPAWDGGYYPDANSFAIALNSDPVLVILRQRLLLAG